MDQLKPRRASMPTAMAATMVEVAAANPRRRRHRCQASARTRRRASFSFGRAVRFSQISAARSVSNAAGSGVAVKSFKLCARNFFAARSTRRCARDSVVLRACAISFQSQFSPNRRSRAFRDLRRRRSIAPSSVRRRGSQRRHQASLNLRIVFRSAIRARRKNHPASAVDFGSLFWRAAVIKTARVAVEAASMSPISRKHRPNINGP